MANDDNYTPRQWAELIRAETLYRDDRPEILNMIEDFLGQAIREAVAAENAACAKIARHQDLGYENSLLHRNIAFAIAVAIETRVQNND